MTTFDAPDSRRSVLTKVIIGALCAAFLVAACVAAFLLGTRHTGSQVLSGTAVVGADEASVTVDGWTYGFTPSAVTWYDANGAENHGDMPPCLRQAGGSAAIRFGAVPVVGPNGNTWRQVTWVSCIQ